MKHFKLFISAGLLCCSLTAISGDHSYGHKKSELFSKASSVKWSKKINVIFGPGTVDENQWHDGSGTVDIYAWNGSGWDYTKRFLYTYDTNGWITQRITQGTVGEDIERLTYTYNNEGRVLSEKTENYENGGWVDFQRMEREADDYQHVLSEIMLEWNGSTWDTLWFDKNQYVLNDDHFIVEHIMQEYGGYGVWENYYKGVMTYDTVTGLPAEGVFYNWDGASWIERNKMTDLIWYEYDQGANDGYTEFYIDHEWNGSAWDSSRRETDEYDEFGGRAAVSERYVSGTWENELRQKRIHDLNSEFISYKAEIENGTGWQLFYEMTAENTYDADDNLVEQIYKEAFNGGQLTYTDRYVFSDFPSGISTKPAEITLYPNPAKDLLTIVLPSGIKTASIYNQLGQNVSSLEITDQKNLINVSGLASGLYIIKTTGDKGTYTGKFIKE